MIKKTLLVMDVKRFILALLFLLSLWPGLVLAHADYARSEPAADAVLTEAPAEVHVWFTEELFRREGANSLRVFGPTGDRVDQGDARIDDDDRTHMLVSLPPELPDGRYTVRWQTLSVEDGHSAEEEFGFTVGEIETGTASEPAAEAAPSSRGGWSCLGGMMPGLLLVGGSGFFFSRKKEMA